MPESILIYCDTNFFIDYFYDRRDNIRPLGEFASLVLRRTFSCEFRIAISDWLLKEIENNGCSKPMRDLIARLIELNKFVEVRTAKEDLEFAKRLPLHYGDGLHAALAIKVKAKCIVTNNMSDFIKVIDKIDCVQPQEL